MNTKLLVDQVEFWGALSADIAEAQGRVLVQAMTFEGDTVGQRLVAALRGSSAGDRRLLVDSYSRYVVNDRFVYDPRGLCDRAFRAEVRGTQELVQALRADDVGVRFTNPVGPLFVRYPERNHKKLVVIDDRISYLGGFNFSEHNFAWHDMMVRIDSEEVAAFLRDDFDATWRGENRSESRRFGSGELFVLNNGGASRDHYARLLDLIATARESVRVHSPYVTFPFTDAFREAASRGAEVTVMIPAVHNKPIFKHALMGEAERHGFRLMLFQGGMSHLKAILIDDRTLIFGSSNFDFVSYHLEQEVVAVLDDPALVRAFMDRIWAPDLSQAIASTEPASAWKSWLSTTTLRGLAAGMRRLGGR